MVSITYSYFSPDFEEICMDCSRPIADSGLRPRVGRRPSLGGLTTKATMSFRMNRMAFDAARYRGLMFPNGGRGKGFRAGAIQMSRPMVYSRFVEVAEGGEPDAHRRGSNQALVFLEVSR